MAHFYGTVRGRAQTTASREGSQDSGLVVTAISYEGEIKVDLYFNKHENKDWVYITHRFKGQTKKLYAGPINPEEVHE